MLLCAHHNQLLLSSLSSALRGLCRYSAHGLAGGDRCFSTDSSSDSSTGDLSSKSESVQAEFEQKLSALQDSQAAPDLQALFRAASTETASASSSSSSQGTRAAQGDSSSSSDAADSSGRPLALFSDRYGYAVLGGVNPEASLQEAGAQQPKLHPSRDFRHGDTYEPTDLTPFSREEQEAWLPRSRSGRRSHHIPRQEVQEQLDYKNVDFLLNFVSPSGRIKPRRLTGLTPTAQAKVARTIKMARQMALLPYEMRVGDAVDGDKWRRMREFKAVQGYIAREREAKKEQ